MDAQDISHKNNEADHLIHQTLPTKEQWRTFESNRLLLGPQKKILSLAFRIVAISILVFHVPLLLVGLWAAFLVGSDCWMRNIYAVYQSILLNKPHLKIMTSPLAKLVRKFKIAWTLNCMAWCGLSLLSLMWLPLYLRVICIIILNALMFIFISRSYFDRAFMHKVTAALIITQLLIVGLRFVLKGDEPDVVMQSTIYSLYLLLMSFLLWSVGNRFNGMHLMRLDSEYAKLVMIDSLTQSQTQLNLEQQALVASNKRVQQFYSGAAHDLRQPVYAMQLYTSMLADDPSLSKALLPKITQSCESINDMFNTLFDYQQTHMNDTELVEKDICIAEVLKSLVLHFQPIATGKGLEIRFKPFSGTITMVPLYLTRILSNLIANALRYTNMGGVLVAVRKTGAGIRFEIWDTGIGIDDHKLKHIFDEFYKINKLDVQNDGLGLGLSIVKQLSERIPHAQITVQSRMGRGSVFKFTVPNASYSAI